MEDDMRFPRVFWHIVIGLALAGLFAAPARAYDVCSCVPFDFISSSCGMNCRVTPSDLCSGGCLALSFGSSMPCQCYQQYGNTCGLAMACMVNQCFFVCSSSCPCTNPPPCGSEP